MNAQELKENGDTGIQSAMDGADAVAAATLMASVASALMMVISLFFLRPVSSFFLKNQCASASRKFFFV